MDSPPPPPKFSSSRPIPSGHLSRTASSSRALEAGSNDDLRSQLGAGGSLRRGHSDGDVLGSHLRGSASSRRADEETWMDFLRESSRPTPRRHAFPAFTSQDPARRQERQAIMQRAALVLADRQRRLTESQEDHVHRRSATGLPFGPPVTAPRGGSSAISRPELLFASLDRFTGPSGSSISGHPLPRRSDPTRSRNRASREITLPRWQPDSEVANCPICGKSFGFWFRKHHCRKCGRVVCANCSPHRITIPRQFIVQPPQDLDQESSSGIPAGIEVVDLTDDGDTETPNAQQGSENLDTPQSPVLRIDPALGGGQEVRLCNPCVPDPNPLPHLPFEPPSRSGIHSFPNPEADGPGTTSNDRIHNFGSGVPRRSSSMQHSSPHLGRPDHDASNASSGHSDVLASSDQRHARPSVPPRHTNHFPPNVPTAYGSVPDRSLHDVSRFQIFCLPPRKYSGLTVVKF